MNDLRARCVERARPFGVVPLVEARLQLHDHAYVLAAARRVEECVDDRRLAAIGAVERRRDALDGRIGGRLPQQIDHRLERLEWMVKQDVASPDRREHARADRWRNPWHERRVVKIRTLHLRKLPQPFEVEHVARAHDGVGRHRQRAREPIDERAAAARSITIIRIGLVSRCRTASMVRAGSSSASHVFRTMSASRMTRNKCADWTRAAGNSR